MFKPVNSKVDFPALEKEILGRWYKEGIVTKYLERNKNQKKTFSFLDGPITANNPMGVHHAWGRTFKDLWQRFYNMRGYRQRFQNGFDCQGLWVEVEVEKELGVKNKKDIENLVPGDRKSSIAKFVELCKERVLKFSAIQTDQSKRLGYFMDWNHSYYTMSEENNYMIWHFLKTCHEHGWIYKGIDSVPWCPRCETAISQHEMLTEDYKQATHESIFFELPIAGRENEYLLVWTTTPWTLPANIAVAVDEQLDYSLVEDKHGLKLWLAKEAVDRVFKTDPKKMIKTAKGKELVGLKYKAPFDDLPAVKKVAEENEGKFHTVIATDTTILPISSEEGTGLVHTAVSAGSEDFKLGKKLGLPLIPVIADNADYIQGFGEFSGKNAKKHPRLILDHLLEREKNGEHWVFEIHNYTHRYPACWRCKTELVWKVGDEWYISMDVKSNPPAGGQNHPRPELGSKANSKENGTLRERMVEVAKKINWIPAFGLDRELDWLKNMHDWLISKKNRYWGLALPIYECLSCGWFEVVGSREELEKKAVSGWDSFEGHSPHKPYIDEVQIACPNCKTPVSRIEPVGNPWLDAGIVPFSTVSQPNGTKPLYLTDKKAWEQWFPADFITESFPGQFKNWFYSLIAMSTVLEETNSFKTVLGFGTLLGEDGRAMHKSWGNAIEFNQGADKIGVDVMRWMYVTHNPAENLLFGYHKADETRRRFHLILWNIYNFFVSYANLDEYQISQVDGHTPKHVLDRWILSRLNNTIGVVTTTLEGYNAFTASLAIESLVGDLSTWYVRRSRHRVGPLAQSSEDRIACYRTLAHTLVTLAHLLAPFTPFIAEEIYKNLTGRESVHLSNWPVPNNGQIDDVLEKQMVLGRKIVEVGHAIRKEQKLKTRQPLARFWHEEPGEKITNSQILDLVADELNIEQIIEASQVEGFIKRKDTVFKDVGGFRIWLDVHIDSRLKAKGETRDFIRQVQVLRKEAGYALQEKIRIVAPAYPKEFENMIKEKTLATAIIWGEKLEISKD